ncbi:MAG: type II toxin-antitoxin system HicA family toxin [Syntrophothermus sp.]
MSDRSFTGLEKILQALGFIADRKKGGRVVWKGKNLHGDFEVIPVHPKKHDIPTGTLSAIAKQLGFKTLNDYFDFLGKL